MTPQNRDETGRFIAGQSGNPGGRPLGFREQIKEITAEGSELVEVVHSVLIDANASNKERMDAATWLADRGWGKPPPENITKQLTYSNPIDEMLMSIRPQSMFSIENADSTD